MYIKWINSLLKTKLEIGSDIKGIDMYVPLSNIVYFLKQLVALVQHAFTHFWGHQ